MFPGSAPGGGLGHTGSFHSVEAQAQLNFIAQKQIKRAAVH